MISMLSKKHDFDMVHDSQQVFRILLTASANPARVLCIKEFADRLHGPHSALLAIAMTLLDNEVCFYAGEDTAFSDEIVLYTRARRSDIRHADFIFTANPDELKNAILNAKSGTLFDPHKSATIISEDSGDGSVPVSFSGPGILKSTHMCVSETAKNAVHLRDAQNYEYPRGIDFLFVSREGDIFSCPRLTRMEG